MKRILVLVLIGVVSVVSPGAPSEALALAPSHRTIDDKTGDARAQVDITKLQVSLTSKRLQATFHVRDLTRKRRSSYWIGGDFFAGYPDLWLITWKDRSGAVVTDLRAGEDGFRRHCRKARATWNYKNDFVHVSFPQGCKGYTFSDGKFAASTEMGSSYDGVPDFKLAAAKVPVARGAKVAAPPPVTWTGWQGVKFDTKLTAAHAQLGGTLTRSATRTAPGPDVMTQTSWYGISLGDSMTRVADDHGWSTGSCVGASIPDYVNVPRHFRVEVARGRVAGKVGRIVSWGKVRGPHGVKHRVKVSQIAKFLKRGVKHPVMPGTEWGWTYWVIPMKSHFFVVRTGTDSGSGSPHRVEVFGLAKSRAVANDIGSTQGGCI